VHLTPAQDGEELRPGFVCCVEVWSTVVFSCMYLTFL
jgi:hypothetical protein